MNTNTTQIKSTTSSSLFSSDFGLWVFGCAAGLKRTQHLAAGKVRSLHHKPLTIYCGRQRDNMVTHKATMADLIIRAKEKKQVKSQR